MPLSRHLLPALKPKFGQRCPRSVQFRNIKVNSSLPKYIDHSMASTSKLYIVPQLTEDDIAALKASLPQYKEASRLHGDGKKDARKNAIQRVLTEFKRNHPGIPKQDWETMKMVSFNFPHSSSDARCSMQRRG